ncbi:glycine/D-amino acid oxidase-like deaminating enzyme [Deinobacterium chartae]|uniref:Glycine/D-amino acid oxidase-like deaminating enzyme n=1 Tax=Deinobacterium chartae TaxID=521158 RepID=A0A841HW08_9DEIO|nr:FAD-dependent oxidoreductase [Deinobacterium chartae]MBB6097711.1 glycine/D-amino acid oxidase-like deaminating enzyme [Deinobacterium chartae]
MPDLIVIGGGIAGSSLSYLAARAGLRVTLIDAAQARASDVPSALLNPVRGQGGRVEARALEGLRYTWALLAALEEAGYPVPHGRSGVLRPVPDPATQAKWSARLPAGLPHRWREPQELSEVGLGPAWHAVLELPEGGWLDGAALCRALRAASGALTLRAQVARWDARTVTLAGGELLEARRVVFCGGSWGSSRAGLPGVHRRGSLLRLARPLSPVPVSFGAYAAPARAGGVLGATFEAPTDTYRDDPLPLHSLAWLLDKQAALFGHHGGELTGVWTASRLGGGLRFGPQTDGSYALSGLGSKGFLLGPLLASELLRLMLPFE